MDDAVKDRVLAHVREGVPPRTAAAMEGVELAELARQSVEDPEFFRALLADMGDAYDRMRAAVDILREIVKPRRRKPPFTRRRRR